MEKVLLASIGVLLAAAAQPARAQLAPLPASTLSFAKSDAILGGAPSRFAALMAQQNGGLLPIPATAVPMQARSASTVATLTPFRSAPRPSLFSRAIASDKPDVFGSVALAVRRTSLDRRWHAVEGQRASGTSAHYAASLRAMPALARLDLINRFVNARVQFVDDSRAYRRADVWQGAADTMRRGRGDCEDYAIAKLGLLRAAGFAERDLYLVIVKDLVRRSDHAVLVARAEDKLLLLDNGSDRLGDATAMQDYRPVLSYSAGRAWTHGYQRPTYTLASAAAILPGSGAK